MASTTTPSITASKAPSITASKNATMAFINTHKVGDTIGNGHLYVAWFLLILLDKGHTLAIDGNTCTIYSKGKAIAMVGWSKSAILNKCTDMSGNNIIVAGPLKVERILAWAQQGKVVPNVKGIVLGKAARVAIAAGSLPK